MSKMLMKGSYGEFERNGNNKRTSAMSRAHVHDNTGQAACQLKAYASFEHSPVLRVTSMVFCINAYSACIIELPLKHMNGQEIITAITFEASRWTCTVQAHTAPGTTGRQDAL